MGLRIGSSMIGLSDAAGDGCGQSQKVLRVPGVEGFRFGFEGAIPEKGVMNTMV
jgi:hypothetical protein